MYSAYKSRLMAPALQFLLGALLRIWIKDTYTDANFIPTEFLGGSLWNLFMDSSPHAENSTPI